MQTLHRSGFESMASTTKALKKMQKQLGLNETGELDKVTVEAMKRPRCGVPDVANYKTFDGDLKWDHQDVTYRWVERLRAPRVFSLNESLPLSVWKPDVPLLFSVKGSELLPRHGELADRRRLRQSLQGVERRDAADLHPPLWRHSRHHDLLRQSR